MSSHLPWVIKHSRGTLFKRRQTQIDVLMCLNMSYTFKIKLSCIILLTNINLLTLNKLD